MENKKFVIVIPSFNNERWCEKSLLSAVGQQYDGEFRIILTNDCSTDATQTLLENLIVKNNFTNVKLINNNERLGALHNLYNMIHSCNDQEICVDLDGDDFLIGPNVLTTLNEVYQDENVWMTYGSYLDSGPMTLGCCKPYEEQVIKTNAYRSVSWRASHLRSRYSKLFKMIKKEDLMHDGKFYESAWDCSYQFPMLELSAGNHKFISDALYIYNNDNPISDFRVKQQQQGFFDGVIRRKQPYKKLDKLF